MNFFWDTFTQQTYFLRKLIIIFWGDLTDVSAKTANCALAQCKNNDIVQLSFSFVISQSLHPYENHSTNAFRLRSTWALHLLQPRPCWYMSYAPRVHSSRIKTNKLRAVLLFSKFNDFFGDTLIQDFFLRIMKMNIFRDDLIDISA